MWLIRLTPSYIVWHYTTGIRGVVAVWSNLMWFLYFFFSIPVLAKTLFSPWKRMHEGYGNISEPGQFFGSLVMNLIIRLVGAVIRLSVVVCGIVILIIGFMAGFFLIVGWVFAPVLFFVFLVTALQLIAL